MKKSLISLAVASVVALPLAASAMGDDQAPWYDGTEVYGSVRAQLVSQDGLSVQNGTSRWGVKGAHDLGNGLSGVYRMEYGFDSAGSATDFASRLGYAGVSGGFGTIALGEQWTPYYNAVGAPSDIFCCAGIGLSHTPFRTGNALAYALPGGAALGGAIALVMNANAGTDEDGNAIADDDDVDAINAGFTFAAGPVTIGLGAHDQEGADDTLVGLSIGGNFGGFGLTLLAEDDGNTTPMAITATYAGFMLQFSDDDADDEAITVGYNHKLGPKTQVQFAVEDRDSYDDAKAVARVRVDF